MMKYLVLIILCTFWHVSRSDAQEDPYVGHTEIELTTVSAFISPVNFGADLTAYDPFIVDHFHLSLMYGGDNTLLFDPYIHLGFGALALYDPIAITLGLEYSQPLRLGVKYLGRVQLTSHAVVLEGEGIGMHLFVRGFRDLHLSNFSIQAGIGMTWIDEYDIEM